MRNYRCKIEDLQTGEIVIYETKNGKITSANSINFSCTDISTCSDSQKEIKNKKKKKLFLAKIFERKIRNRLYLLHTLAKHTEEIFEQLKNLTED